MNTSVWRDAGPQLRTQEVLDALEDIFKGLARGDNRQPGQVSLDLPDGGGDVIYYPAVLGSQGLIGVAVSPYLTRLAEAGENPVTNYMLVLSAETGEPVLLCEGHELVVIRTGATSALAARVLAKSRVEKIAIIGSGPIAVSHCRFLKHVFGESQVSVWSPSLIEPDHSSRRKLFAATASKVTFGKSLEDCVAQADIVALCTSSVEPIVKHAVGSEESLLISVGTDGPLAHEIAPLLLPEMDVYCDYRPTTPSVAGEMVLATQAGAWSAERILADLGELISERVAPEDTGRRRYFRSVGLGVEDLAMASLVLESGLGDKSRSSVPDARADSR